MKGPHFFEKRKKEMARQEKLKEKAARKAQRKAGRGTGEEGGEDPDLEGIVAGPQIIEGAEVDTPGDEEQQPTQERSPPAAGASNGQASGT